MLLSYDLFERQFILLLFIAFRKKGCVMEFKCDNVIVLYLAGKPQVAIVRAFQHLSVNKPFVSRTIGRYRTK